MYRFYQRLIIVSFLILLSQNSASSRQLSSEIVEVSFNHLVMFVDSSTYNDIKNNMFLKEEFATFEHRTTVRSNDSYTGIYFYGTNTYLELFNADADTVYQEGDCGIGLSTDDSDGIITLKDLLSSSYSLITDTVSRKWDSQLIPWFSSISIENTLVESDFVIWTWIMKYMPEFLRGWHPTDDDSSFVVTRQTVLDRYKSVLTSQVYDPIMTDVSCITIAADSLETVGMTSLFRTIGFKIESSDNEIVLYSKDFSFVIIPEAPETRGLTEVRFITSRKPVFYDKINFGQKSELYFQSDSLAIWLFHH